MGEPERERFRAVTRLAYLAGWAGWIGIVIVAFIPMMIIKGVSGQEIATVLKGLQPFVLPLIGVLGGYALAQS